MKKMMFAIFALFCCVAMVKADSSNVYYTSNYGVQLTEKEYNLFVELYGEDIIANLTPEKYDAVNILDIDNNEIETVVYDDHFNQIANPGISLYATYVETTYKRLAISKSCNIDGLCAIVVSLRWKAVPTVRSYDLIGARYNQSVAVQSNSISTYIEYANSYNYCANYRVESNGHACSFKLKTTQDIVSTTQSFVAYNTGTIFASYQHASSYVTSTESQQYYFSYTGSGNVFSFYGGALGCYDGMNGVYISI